MCNHFLTHAGSKVQGGELRGKTWADYHNTCSVIVERVGRDRRVEDLGPADFRDLRVELSKTYGPHRVGKIVTVARMVFRHAFDVEMIDLAVRFGDKFKKPDKVLYRRSNRNSGRRLYTGDDLCRLIQACDKNHQLRAMILLAVNGGLGQTDCGSLRITGCNLDHETPHLDYPRIKTEIERVVPLWPETVPAIRKAIEHRHRPRPGVHQKRWSSLGTRLY